MMKITPISHCPKNLILTPRRFQRLDRIARAKGSALMPMRFEEMGRCWGRYSFMSGGVRVDVINSPKCAEVCVIEIAMSINVESFHACSRPEIDYSAIPSSKIYDFVLMHELGHKLNNFSVIDFMISHVVRDERLILYKDMLTVNEILADRFAWESLFPTKTIPKAAYCDAGLIEERMARLQEHGFIIKHYQIKPLTVEPGQYIPLKLLDIRFQKYWNWDIATIK